MRIQLYIISWLFLFASPIVLKVHAQSDSAMIELIFKYGSIGYKHTRQNLNLDTAEYYLKEALRLQYTTPGYKIDERVVGNHINLASVYKRIYNNNEALYHLNKAEAILKEIDPNSVLFGFLYYNKGNVIRSNNDLFRTREYYEYALDWLDKTGHNNSFNYLEIYSNYLDVLYQMKEYDAALEFLTRVDLNGYELQPSLRFKYHLIQGKNFTILQDYQKAE